MNEHLLLLFVRAAQRVQVLPLLLLQLLLLFLCMACAAVSRLVSSAAEAPYGSSAFGSIFVFVPSLEDVTALTEALQQHLRHVLKQHQPQQQEGECSPRPVEIVCLAPGTNMSFLRRRPFPFSAAYLLQTFEQPP